MRKKLVQALLLFAIMVSLSASSAAPLQGHDEEIETDVAAQTKTTNKNLYAGVTKSTYEISALYVKQNELGISLSSQKEMYEAWTTTNVNIRKHPYLGSEVIGVLNFNTHFMYSIVIDDWAQIEYKGEVAYIHSDYITDTEPSYTKYLIPPNSGFKSFMSYKAITDKTSKQYIIQSQYVYTGNYGLRQVYGRYCVAIGTAFNAEIGDYADLILENGEVIPIVVSDIKDDKDTEKNNIVTMSNGCVSEFIVDDSMLSSEIKKVGDISACNDKWGSKVTLIKIYHKNIFN